MKKLKLLTITIAIVIVIIILIYNFRGYIARWRYSNVKEELINSLTEKQKEEYRKDLDYTMDKFWDCYDHGLISQNDMVDVMEKTRTLIDKEEITRSELFEFVGYVSRIYTDAIQKHNREIIMEKNEKARREKLKQAQ
jgi:hypothetical protein